MNWNRLDRNKAATQQNTHIARLATEQKAIADRTETHPVTPREGVTAVTCGFLALSAFAAQVGDEA